MSLPEILFISYYFPPMAGSGVQRVFRFVQYLPQYGLQPVIITVQPRFVKWVKDPSLLAQIQGDLPVYRTPTLDPGWLFKLFWGLRLPGVVDWLLKTIFIPDPEIVWVKLLKPRLDKIISQRNIKAVFISGGPFSAFLLVPYISQKYKLPCHLDFRDEWTNNPTRLDTNYPRNSRQRENHWESEAMRCASSYSYINKLMQQNFVKKYPSISDRINQVIPNGFDEAEFRQIKPSQSYAKDKLNIVYLGTFYGRRNPDALWQALDKGIATGVINPDKIRFSIIGKNNTAFVLGKYHHSALSRLISFSANVSHQESLNYMAGADALLLFIAPGPNCEAELTGKVFEYIRSHTPILAVVPPLGVAAELISESQTGFICDSQKPDEILSGLVQMYQAWQAGKLVTHPREDVIARFDRQVLTSDLAKTLQQIISS